MKPSDICTSFYRIAGCSIQPYQRLDASLRRRALKRKSTYIKPSLLHKRPTGRFFGCCTEHTMRKDRLDALSESPCHLRLCPLRCAASGQIEIHNNLQNHWF